MLGVGREGGVLAGLWHRMCSFLLGDNFAPSRGILLRNLFVCFYATSHKITNSVATSLFFNGNRIRF